ncbi:MAG: M48 family peptidase [Alphaproteobacteria bacterium]|nr:MAG: M48 family peptidase [Alphaproteobacteria bacterium]
MARRSSAPKVLRLGDYKVPLVVSRHPRARHISLRLDGITRSVRMVLPRRAALVEGLEFAETKADWLLEQLEALPEPVPFADGAVVPILGIDHTIRHDPAARRGVWRAAGVIRVSGFAEHLPRRVRDFLKALARSELAARCHAKAARIGRTVRRISVREMRTRWGSCNANGDMSFCWRLILAPEWVVDYVVAHEVAHLAEMNHGPRFWALTARLTDRPEAARHWLRRHGEGLLRYG